MSACTSSWSCGEYERCKNHQIHKTIHDENDDKNDVWTKYEKSEITVELMEVGYKIDYKEF